MGKCRSCGRENPLIAEVLALCRDCIQEGGKELESQIEKVHQQSRSVFNLIATPPQSKEGLSCNFCFNQCRISYGETGFCGLRKNKNGQKIIPSPREGYFSWYYDPLATNCVADWICPGGTGAGYPEYAYNQGPEYGFKNLPRTSRSHARECQKAALEAGLKRVKIGNVHLLSGEY